jgi:alginate O-acetyltransferase complex protein AlgI
MLFNSSSFIVFFPIVYILYWFVFNKKGTFGQNLLLLLSSYYFYSCWDWRFLFLLIFSTLLDYFTAIKINESKTDLNRKFWFWLSVTINLGFLSVFKYYNFFAESFQMALSQVGIKFDLFLLNIILPVGISFYTFHGLSYVIDIYKKRIEPERNFVDYSVFVSYFPLLVAGPIERATHLLPQIKIKREFNYEKSVNGLRQILWGFFKKVVIADNCSEYVNLIFNDYASFNGSTLILGAFLFALQIYGDFSGYSDIALGTSRLLGIELLQNFAFPYFSRDIAEFWRRWHISLSSWFRDYVYFPLGGSKGNLYSKIRNTIIIFLLSGFWHGANWTFIFWGLLNAIYFIPLMVLNLNRSNIEVVAKGKFFPSFIEFMKILLNFILVTIAWVFFRANSISDAFSYLQLMFSNSMFSAPYFAGISKIIPLGALIFLFIFIEWIGRSGKFAIDNLGCNWHPFFKYLFYYSIIFMIIYFGNFEESQFIYFQF